MKLTTKGRYAVTALLDMAIHGHIDKPLTVGTMAERQGLSVAYLERLLGQLREMGILTSVRGPGGGYLLSRSADVITVAEIINAVDESVDATRCAGEGNCQQGKMCLTHHLWEELNQAMEKFFSQITLGELSRRPSIQLVAQQQNKLFTIQEA